MNNIPLDWGVYRMTLGNSSPSVSAFENPESYTQWSASVAGSGDFGPLSHVPWEALIEGTWSPEGEVRGTAALRAFPRVWMESTINPTGLWPVT